MNEATRMGGGSDDIGDVSWNVPTVTLRYPVEHPGPAGPQLGERDRDGDADRAQGRRGGREGPGDDAARHSPDAEGRRRRVGLLPQRADEGHEVHAVPRTYDKPAIWLNADIMAKYRDEMRKYYYDPTKFKTYLEQLGIKYPVVKSIAQ